MSTIKQSNHSNNMQPDIGVILQQLRTAVRAQRLAQGGNEPSPIERDLQRSLDEIELYRVVSAHWPLRGKTLPGRAITFVNKLVRRFLRWYINPIVEQQNAYNDAVARTLRLLADAYADLAEQTKPEGGAPVNPEQKKDAPRNDEMIVPSPAIPTTNEHQQLQEWVQQQALSEPPARFADLELTAQEQQLELRQQVNAHWPLEGRTRLEKAAALVHKLTRRYLRWLINPIVEQQNAANTAFTKAIHQLARLDAAHRAEIAAQRANSHRHDGNIVS